MLLPPSCPSRLLLLVSILALLPSTPLAAVGVARCSGGPCGHLISPTTSPESGGALSALSLAEVSEPTGALSVVAEARKASPRGHVQLNQTTPPLPSEAITAVPRLQKLPSSSLVQAPLPASASRSNVSRLERNSLSQAAFGQTASSRRRVGIELSEHKRRPRGKFEALLDRGMMVAVQAPPPENSVQQASVTPDVTAVDDATTAPPTHVESSDNILTQASPGKALASSKYTIPSWVPVLASIVAFLLLAYIAFKVPHLSIGLLSGIIVGVSVLLVLFSFCVHFRDPEVSAGGAGPLALIVSLVGVLLGLGLFEVTALHSLLSALYGTFLSVNSLSFLFNSTHCDLMTDLSSGIAGMVCLPEQHMAPYRVACWLGCSFLIFLLRPWVSCCCTKGQSD